MKKIEHKSLERVYIHTSNLKNKGITLIALTITIIILLILTGITIVGLTRNGLFGKTEIAKQKMRYASAKEAVNLKLMEIQVECTEKDEKYNIKKIAEGMKLAEDITIEKYYNKGTGTIKDGVTENLTNLEGIVVSVDEYSEYKFLIGEKCEIEGVLEGEVTDTTSIEEFVKIEEFEKKAFISESVTDTIKFSYEKIAIVSNKIQILITIKDEENGLNKIEYPDGDILNCNGKKQIGIDYIIECGVEYVFKITSNNGYVKEVTIKEETFITIANEPDIDGFNKANTYYVSWNENTEKTAYIPEERRMSETNAPSNWYDYTQGVNHWANIKTTGSGNDCYWVWIPRYAYKVPTKGETAETIEVKFLEGETNKPVDGTTEITNTTPTPGTWVVHPAFTNEGNGGFGELTGIWVAKFEASSSSVSEATINTDLNGTGGGNVTNLQVRVKPNVTSWRGITVNNIFTVCRNLTEVGNSLEDTSNLNSHMMKNTEWGAVAYLSRSIYGINAEVWNNPYYYNTASYSPITGLCGKESNGKDNATMDRSNTYKYNEVGGENASTTGNVYGVYDMAGGTWEYVAGIYKGGTSDDNRSKLWDSNNSKYVDQYTETTGSQSTYYGNINKYGDAVYETSSSGNSITGSWDYSDSIFPVSDSPVFGRGGVAYDGRYAGVFAFTHHTGVAYNTFSFRPVVLSSRP